MPLLLILHEGCKGRASPGRIPLSYWVGWILSRFCRRQMGDVPALRPARGPHCQKNGRLYTLQTHPSPVRWVLDRKIGVHHEYQRDSQIR